MTKFLDLILPLEYGLFNKCKTVFWYSFLFQIAFSFDSLLHSLNIP